MALLGMRDLTIAFGGPPILEGASFGIDRGERVCLLGRNGAGKSTVMKLLDGSLNPDRGEIVRQGGVTVARLEQEIPGEVPGSVFDVVAAGLGDTGTLLARYHEAGVRVGNGDANALRDLGRLHHELDVAGAWQFQSQVETVISHLGLDQEAPFVRLSGGRKRQALLARALVRDPDVLLLDEPTNHLDVDAIEWMEDFLRGRKGALCFVTHDRTFLSRLATRIVELDRGRLMDWGVDYTAYLERKDAALAAEEREWAEFDKQLAREEAWIRQGIKARRTRNEGRVRSLEAMRRERAARREREGTVRLTAQEAERGGRIVVEAREASFAHGERPIVRELTTTVARGDRIGIIGPNGSGKTTLLRLLLGEIPPDSGVVRPGTGIEIAYFDQLREQLDPNRTVQESIAGGAEFVDIGENRKHVLGYLQDFLFPPERARTPVRALSGGERNRLLLARLFTRSFNVLAMDEPTNDLDIETLDLLEDLLLEYSGTLLVVSHDRTFLDNVVTSTLVMEGHGWVGEYAGGYSDWARQRARTRPTPAPVKPPPRAAAIARPAARRKLSIKEKKELAGLPDRIHALEQERGGLYASLADPAVLRDGAAAAQAKLRLESLGEELAAVERRWEELETLAGESGG